MNEKKNSLSVRDSPVGGKVMHGPAIHTRRFVLLIA